MCEQIIRCSCVQNLSSHKTPEGVKLGSFGVGTAAHIKSWFVIR